MTSPDGADNTAQDVNGSDASAGQVQDVKSPETGSSPDQTTDVNKQSSSSDEGQGKPEAKTLKDSINDAIDKVSKPKVDAKETQQKPEGDQDTQGNTKPVEDEQDKDVPKDVHTQPWFKKLVSERKQARQERDQFRKEVEEFRHDATQYRTIQNYLKEANVDPRDAAESLQLTRLYYENPQEFYQTMLGKMREWGEQLGVVLPRDLQTKVDEGSVDLETAKELAKTRAMAQTQTVVNERLTEQQIAERQHQEHIQRQNLVQSWAEQVSKTDPDLKRVMPLVADRVVRLKDQLGAPRSQQEAWDRLNQAYKQIKDETRSFMPPKPSTPPSQQPSQMMRGGVAAPRNFNEALDSAIDRVFSGNK